MTPLLFGIALGVQHPAEFSPRKRTVVRTSSKVKVRGIPTSFTVGSDGAVWLGTLLGNPDRPRGDGYVERIDPVSKAVTTYSVPNGQSTHAGIRDITNGPDGNLWFGVLPDSGGDADIAQMTTGGSAKVFSGSSEAHGLAVGPDGNLWTTTSETGFSHVFGRITTGGDYTTVPVAGPQDWMDPFAIVAPITGMFDDLWSCVGSNYPNSEEGLVAQTIGGTYVTGVYVHNCALFVYGPDGNMWVGDLGIGLLEISSNGILSVFSASGGPIGAMHPDAIDDSIWYGTEQNNQIGLSEFSLADHSTTTYLLGPTEFKDRASTVNAFMIDHTHGCIWYSNNAQQVVLQLPLPSSAMRR
jgi:hypothetical protein